MAYVNNRYKYDTDDYRGVNWVAVLLVPLLILGALYVGYKVLTNNGTERNIVGFTPTVTQNNPNIGKTSGSVVQNNANVGIGTTSPNNNSPKVGVGGGPNNGSVPNAPSTGRGE